MAKKPENSIKLRKFLGEALALLEDTHKKLSNQEITSEEVLERAHVVKRYLEDFEDTYGKVSPPPPLPVQKPFAGIASTGRKLAIVVGHTAKDQGASGVEPISTSEYIWNKDLAQRIVAVAQTQGITTQVFLRDGVGISGAYARVARFKPDAAIELHFNSNGGRARGTETLYGDKVVKSKDFARIVQEAMVQVYGRTGKQDRGLKVRKPGDGQRGSMNVNALQSIPSCLIEPFFGDNPEDARLGHERKDQLAAALVIAFLNFR